MKILVIGGTRFIGRHVVPRLLQAGHEVTLFNRGYHPNPFSRQVSVIVGDRKVSGQLVEKTKTMSFDAVIDMVAYTKEDMIEAIQAFSGKTKHFIFISTRSVYKQPVCVPIRENDPLEDNPVMSYGFKKVEAESVLMQAYQSSGFPGTILRMPAIYGEFDYQVREWYFIKRLLDNQPHMLLPAYGLGVNHREYAGNIAEQVAFLLSKSESIGEIFNSGHMHFQSYRELVKMAAALMHKEIILYNIKPSLLPWQIPLAGDGLRIVSTRKLETLGYEEPFSVKQGLLNTIEYFSKHPVKAWLLAERQGKDLLDYNLEEALIREHGQLIE